MKTCEYSSLFQASSLGNDRKNRQAHHFPRAWSKLRVRLPRLSLWVKFCVAGQLAISRRSKRFWSCIKIPEREYLRISIKRLSKQPERWSCRCTLDQYSDLIGFTNKRNKKGRNRHNLDCFFWRCHYISAGQTSLPQVQWEFHIGIYWK